MCCRVRDEAVNGEAGEEGRVREWTCVETVQYMTGALLTGAFRADRAEGVRLRTGEGEEEWAEEWRGVVAVTVDDRVSTV